MGPLMPGFYRPQPKTVMCPFCYERNYYRGDKNYMFCTYCGSKLIKGEDFK